MFDAEVRYGLSVIGATDEQQAKYGYWIIFVLEMGDEWPLLCPKFLCLLVHQLIYDQYHKWNVENQTNSMKAGYQMAFQNPVWIEANAKLALHWRHILPVPTLNILCP